jgi:hypothetical protein
MDRYLDVLVTHCTQKTSTAHLLLHICTVVVNHLVLLDIDSAIDPTFETRVRRQFMNIYM